MVLTEPDAGSDVGAGRTKAVPNDDGTWTITGVKRFITSAESDMVDNVVHFVLARPEGAGPGTKGLSLFILPKYDVDLETGELGERNGVYVTNVERKMGLKVSTTCELTFGGERPAVGTLLGDVHNGIAQMFHVIENARMLVGTKAIATLSTGYLNALDYAKQRVQGADLTQSTDKAAPRVTITHHPDVRRSLMTQKAYAEGLRALVLYTASQQDVVDQARLATGSEHFETGSAADIASRVNDLLLPIVKGLGSERAWVLLGTESLQTFGGSGFLQDYPIEQYVRDAKIDTLYEGTTAIQGLDFFFRKIVKDKGQALTHLSAQIQEFAKDLGSHDGRLDRDRELLGQGLEDVQGILGFMVGELMKSDPSTGGDMTNLYAVGQNTSRLLLGAGDLVVGWLLLRQAQVALDALAAGASRQDKDFYEGKVAAAQFYARQVLPACRPTAPSPRPPTRSSWTCRSPPSEARPPPNTGRPTPRRGGPSGTAGRRHPDAVRRRRQRGSTSVRSTREPVAGSTWVSRTLVTPARRRPASARDSTMASAPASMRIQPRVSSSMPGRSMSSAKARIAPSTMRTMPSPMYMRSSWWGRCRV